MMSKVAKGKGKTRGRNGKPERQRDEEPDNESIYSFQMDLTDADTGEA